MPAEARLGRFVQPMVAKVTTPVVAGAEDGCGQAERAEPVAEEGDLFASEDLDPECVFRRDPGTDSEMTRALIPA